MNSLLKRTIERAFNCRIYRKSLPRGADLSHDLDTLFGAANFRTVLDVGANAGQSALAYLESFPLADIYSFEPVAETFEELKLATGKAGPRFHGFNLALGAHPGSAEIFLHGDSKINSIVHNRSDRKQTIQVETLDRVLDEEQLAYVDFLKIDTEGFELEVLSGAGNALRDHRIGIIFVESEPIPTERHFIPFQDLVRVLAAHDYRLLGIYEQQPHWTGEKDLYFFNPVFVASELVSSNVTPASYMSQVRGPKLNGVPVSIATRSPN